METNRKCIKSLLCQVDPKLKLQKTNIERVRVSMEHYSREDKLDIVIFPEMSFTGYNFEDQEDVIHLATKCGESLQFDFCIQLAKRLRSYVAFGYIERAIKGQKQVLYNSAVVIDREGNLILNYQKNHLYFCDQLWCQEGNGFKSFNLITTQGKNIKCCLTIGMDINAKHFTSGQYELADYMVQNNVETLLMLSNLIDNQPDPSKEKNSLTNIYNYWFHRLRPLTTPPNNRQILFLTASRVGSQYSYFDKKDVHFFGGSCAMMLNPNYLIQNLGKSKQGYLIIQSQLPQ